MKHSTPAVTKERDLSFLRTPPIERKDLVIVGGGPSGVTAAMRLIHDMEQDAAESLQKGTTPTRFKGLSSVTMLAGGPSLAFSPVTGDFGAFLTLYGSDKTRRDETLASSTRFVERKFAHYRFDFKKKAFAKTIEVGPDQRYLIATETTEGPRMLSAKKLVLAVGHSLKERPLEVQEHVFKGTNDLCSHLQAQSPLAKSREECLDRLLSKCQRTPDGSVRIGLVGMGLTFLEVIKIFHALLDPPHGPHRAYRTRGSGIPVQFVLYDPRFNAGIDPIDGMVIHLDNFHAHISNDPEPGSLLTAEGVAAYKRAEKGRIHDLVRTKQVSVVPERFDWSSIHLNQGAVVSSRKDGRQERFSLVIDCSPFNVGISKEQRALMVGIPALNFTPTPDGTFQAELQRDTPATSIALVGAAFAPRDKWGLGTLNEQGMQAVDSLFPR